MKEQRGEHDTDRSEGGPGSSHQGGSHHPARRDDATAPAPSQPTNTDRSRTSGGGGERDRHHTHDPATKA